MVILLFFYSLIPVYFNYQAATDWWFFSRDGWRGDYIYLFLARNPELNH